MNVVFKKIDDRRTTADLTTMGETTGDQNTRKAVGTVLNKSEKEKTYSHGVPQVGMISA